ncbi:ABC transporter substrate binding protein [Bacillus cereus]|nr:ABC transporter substrate binding protein [Paenibacillus dendritiformis]MEB9897097.1 ABC transporter substrate binding protein [Bacillus cereus]
MLGIGTSVSQAAAKEVKDVPVLFTAVTDPVGAGLVQGFGQERRRRFLRVRILRSRLHDGQNGRRYAEARQEAGRHAGANSGIS